MKETYRISDYAIEIKGLPRIEVSKEEVIEHFSRFGEIIEVYIGRRFGDALKLYTERAKITEEIILRESLLVFKNENAETDKAIIKLKAKRLKFDEKINKSQITHRHDELEIKRAYIVFNLKQDKIRCLKLYNKKNCCGCRVQKKDLQFRKKHKLQLFQCPEPSDIIWENLEIGKCSRLMRFYFSLFITLILLLCSTGMIYYVKQVQSEIPTQVTCVDYNTSAPGPSKSSTQTLCYCANLSQSELFHESNDQCSVYIRHISYALSMKFLSSFGIILVNYFITIMMRQLSKFERPKSKSNTQTKTFKKLLLVMFINTAILTYLVNLSIPYFTSYVLSGKYSDFTRDWFLSVGSLLLSLMITSLGSPHLIFLATAYPMEACRRKFCWKSKKSQYELNKLFIGPEFDIAERTAQIFNVIFTSYLYSGGIPLLNCTCFIYLVIIYYTDKFLVLRHHRSPLSYNQDLYLSALKTLPLAVVLHSIFSLWVYGNPDIFPIAYKEYQGLHEILGDQIASRLEKSSGLCNVILIVISFGLILLLNFLDLVCNCCTKRFAEYSKKEIAFKDIKEEIGRNTLDSYDIRKNPDYALIINEMDDATSLTVKQEGKPCFDTNAHGKQSTSRSLSLQHSISEENLNGRHKDAELESDDDELNPSSENSDLSRDANRSAEIEIPKKMNGLDNGEKQNTITEDYDKCKQDSGSDSDENSSESSSS